MESDTHPFKATIILEELKRPESVFKALEPEIGHSKRFIAELSDRKIIIKAKDPTALRAAVNSYIRLLILLSHLEESI